jgi:hypothetical protein
LLDRGRWWWLVMDRCYCNPGHPRSRIYRCLREFIQARHVGKGIRRVEFMIVFRRQVVL